jgi:hypothetical protein
MFISAMAKDSSFKLSPSQTHIRIVTSLHRVLGKIVLPSSRVGWRLGLDADAVNQLLT